MKKSIYALFASTLILLPIIAFSAPNLASKLQGKILLAVEDKGKTYYIHSDGNRYQITTATAQKIFEKLALGVKNSDLQQIPLKDVGITPEVKKTECVNNNTEIQPISTNTAECNYTAYKDEILKLNTENAILKSQNGMLSGQVSATDTTARKIESLNKEYGLKINALTLQKIEIDSMNNETSVKAIWYSYQDQNKDYPVLANTDFKKEVITDLYAKLDAAWITEKGTPNISINLGKKVSELNTQIYSLQNELERKILELK